MDQITSGVIVFTMVAVAIGWIVGDRLSSRELKKSTVSFLMTMTILFSFFIPFVGIGFGAMALATRRPGALRATGIFSLILDGLVVAVVAMTPIF